MVIARRASLAVLLLLLASASPESAECAWVQWTRERGEWEYRAPFETYDQCKAEIKRHRDEWTRLGAKPERLAWNREAWRIQRTDYECLPDTIDPRGPKGR